MENLERIDTWQASVSGWTVRDRFSSHLLTFAFLSLLVLCLPPRLRVVYGYYMKLCVCVYVHALYEIAYVFCI